MQIKLLDSHSVLTRLYLNNYRDLMGGFYQRVRALVTPTPHARAWCIPDLPTMRKRTSRRALTSAQYECFATHEFGALAQRCESDLTHWIQSHAPHHSPTSISAQWRSIERTIGTYWGDMEWILDVSSDLVRRIYVIPSPFGTHGTFNVVRVKPDVYDIYASYRTDCGPQHLPLTIANALVYILRGVSEDEGTYPDWRARQSITDFLAHHTRLSRYRESLAEGYEIVPETLVQIQYDQSPLATVSMDYYRDLGYPIQTVARLDGERIIIDDVYIDDIQALPAKILRYLITHQGRLVPFDELADVYWGASSDQASLYAMAKAVQKVREALHRHGIYQEIVKTVRKRGYIVK